MIGEHPIPQAEGEKYSPLLGVGTAMGVSDAAVLAKEQSRLKKPE